MPILPLDGLSFSGLAMDI